jgi:competence protein ComFB
MSVTNDLAEIVPSAVDRLVADREHIRNCEACRDDVVALALSKLHPEYSSTDMGRILHRIAADKAKGHTEVTVAILGAIAVVEQNPHHAS